MFRNKKILLEIKEQREILEQEKQELLFIKEQLENSQDKIDVSNIYVWENGGVYSIVRLEVTKIRGRNFSGYGKLVDGYHSTLTDIFSNQVIFQKDSECKIKSEELIRTDSIETSYFARLYSLYEVDKNLLAYTDKKVPLYVLQKLYYKLNNVDTNAYILKKEK